MVLPLILTPAAEVQHLLKASLPADHQRGNTLNNLGCKFRVTLLWPFYLFAIGADRIQEGTMRACVL